MRYEVTHLGPQGTTVTEYSKPENMEIALASCGYPRATAAFLMKYGSAQVGANQFYLEMHADGLDQHWAQVEAYRDDALPYLTLADRDFLKEMGISLGSPEVGRSYTAVENNPI